MRIVTDSKVSLSWSVGSHKNHGLMLSVAIKGGFALKNGYPTSPMSEPPECSGDVYSAEKDGQTSLVYPSDFVFFKPRADVMLVGSAHSSSGRPIAFLDATLRVGRFRKAVHIVGDKLVCTYHSH